VRCLPNPRSFLPHRLGVGASIGQNDVEAAGDMAAVAVLNEAWEPTAADEERVRRWHVSLAECFAEPWRQADPIFLLALAGAHDAAKPAESKPRERCS